jgi:colicin import membrane protein
MLVIAALVTGSSVGCNKTPQEAQEEGIEAQRKANEQVGAAQEEANAKIAEAKRDEVEAANKARENAAEAQANANEKIRDTNRTVTGTDETDARSWAQAKIDDVDNMIDTASAKAQSAAPKAKAQFSTGMKKIKQDRDALSTDVAVLTSSSGDRLDKNKEQFSDRVDRIKSNIRTLEKSL